MKKHLAWVRDYFKKSSRTPVLENFLGLRITGLEEGKVTCGMKAAQRHGNIYGTLHGGTLAAVADFAMGVACVSTGRRVVTIDMNISYIKSAPAGSSLTAVGEVVSGGKRIMRAEGKIYSGGQLLARAQASYYVTGDFTAADHPNAAPHKKSA
ncbi:MAG: PaaI family thioesterase [Elusimicrobia bacterium]|nr:PaaI family thioesterase [Elusimicrobiota bacterium]